MEQAYGASFSDIPNPDNTEAEVTSEPRTSQKSPNQKIVGTTDITSGKSDT